MDTARRAFVGGGAAALLTACERRTSNTAAFTVETVASGLNVPWSMAFLPDGDMLVTEKRAGVRFVSLRGGQARAIAGAPTAILSNGDSGLLDIVLAPDFEQTQTLFISFNEGDMSANRL